MMEKLEEILSEMRRGTIPKHRTDHELLSLYADRIEAAVKRGREELSRRLAAAHEVAENFKNTLTKALDTLAWLKSAESPAARGCGENGGGSSRMGLKPGELKK